MTVMKCFAEIGKRYRVENSIPFFLPASLKEGDEVEVTGRDPGGYIVRTACGAEVRLASQNVVTRLLFEVRRGRWLPEEHPEVQAQRARERSHA